MKEMKAPGMYAIMADEARDHKTEQLSICVCYVESESGKVCEHLLGFSKLHGFSAQHITESIEVCLK